MAGRACRYQRFHLRIVDRIVKDDNKSLSVGDITKFVSQVVLIVWQFVGLFA
jgi:hypothetical protein